MWRSAPRRCCRKNAARLEMCTKGRGYGFRGASLKPVLWYNPMKKMSTRPHPMPENVRRAPKPQSHRACARSHVISGSNVYSFVADRGIQITPLSVASTLGFSFLNFSVVVFFAFLNSFRIKFLFFCFRVKFSVLVSFASRINNSEDYRVKYICFSTLCK